MGKKKVVQLVSKRLAKVGHGIDFSIVEDGVRAAESWWYVPVLATRNGKDVPREVTVNIFTNVEDELERKANLSVMFVPVVPEPSNA